MRPACTEFRFGVQIMLKERSGMHLHLYIICIAYKCVMCASATQTHESNIQDCCSFVRSSVCTHTRSTQNITRATHASPSQQPHMYMHTLIMHNKQVICCLPDRFVLSNRRRRCRGTISNDSLNAAFPKLDTPVESLAAEENQYSAR